MCEKWNMNTAKKTAVTGILLLVIAVLLFTAFCPSAGAVGLVDDTVDAAHEYSRYPLENYQLDFYVDNGWDWLPWNWVDGIGKQVMYGLYCITNFIWTINLYLSNASGFLVQEAYGLDFISGAADAIGKNIQTIAGISPSGLSTDGFYAGFLLLIILIVGAYVAYTGIIKRETTKAVRAVLNMVLIFVLSGAVIAYAPDCVGRLNEFSEDVSTASLTVGTKIVTPGAQSSGGDSVSLIRDSLFSIQVKQPWLLLQFGDTDTEALGEDRVESLLSASPSENNGEDRENVVKTEIEDNGNTNLTVTKTVNRLGTVFFLFLFNIGISVFVFLLTGMMIFSQVLFIIYVMFLPVSFVLSMVPTFESSSRRAVIKLFNTILARAGITLVITVAFSVSIMLYQIADRYPFFIIAFLQVVLFAGTYFKLGDLLSLFSLRDDGTRNMGRHIARRPGMFLYHQLHRLNRSVRSAASKGKPSSSGNSSGHSARNTSGAAYSGQRSSRPNNQSGSTTAGGQPRRLSSSSARDLPSGTVGGGSDGSPQTDMPSMPESGTEMPADTAVHSRPETASAPVVAASASMEVPQEQSEGTQRSSVAVVHDRPVVMAVSGSGTGQAAKPVAQQRQEQPAGSSTARRSMVMIESSSGAGQVEKTMEQSTGASIARRPMVSQHERPATMQQDNAVRSDALQNRPARTTTERPAATAEIRRPNTVQRPVVSAETRRPDTGNRQVMQQAEPIKLSERVQDKPAKPQPAVEQVTAKPETKPAQRKNTVQSKPVANQPGSADTKGGAQNGGGKK